MIIDELFEGPQMCPECGGISFSDLILAEKKDACYHKVKASAKVWPSAYASGRLVQCRKKGAANYGNKSEGVAEGSDQQWVVTVGTKTGGTSHTMTFSGTKEQAIKQAVARFGTSKNPVVTAKPKQQGVAEANLSELNKDTVYSYAKKAHKDQDKQSTITGKAYLDNDPKTANKAHHKFSMRAAGLDRAEKRLNKEGVAEGMSDDMAALAQKKFPNAYISKDGEEVQKPKNWGKRYTPPAAAPADLEKQQRDLTAKYPNIDELVRKAELNRDPDYEMADGQAYYTARDAEQNYQKLRQIQRVIQGLNESLDRSHLP
jgi:hypothetical protein